MRPFIFSISLLSFFLWKKPADNHLAHTRWSGELNTPSPTSGMLEFTQDSLLVYLNGDIVETSSYQVKGDTLSFKKLSGKSPCGDDTGIYGYTIKDSVLIITAIQDACEERKYAFSTDGYKKQ